MTGSINRKRIAALMLAFVFAFVSAFAVVSAPSFAAAKKPAKVSGVKTKVLSSSAIKLTWKKAKNAKKYQIFRATKKSGKYKKIATVSKTTYTSKKLKAGTKYFYKVRGINGAKKGSYSAIKYATTKKAGPDYSKIEIDQEAKSVTINAQINGKYFDQFTRHLIVDNKGFNKGKALMTGFCSPTALFNALVQVGGISWSKSADKTLADGEMIYKGNAENEDYSTVEMTVSWGTETHTLDEILTTVKGGAEPPKINMVISGNPKAAAKIPSGCITCLDSCFIGIVSNTMYGLCDGDNENPNHTIEIYGRPDVLPASGTMVKVTYTIVQ